MDVLAFRILAIICIVLFIAAIVLMKVFKLIDNKYYHEFEQLDLVKETKTANSKNKVYITDRNTRKYVKKLVICKTATNKYMILNYNEYFKKIVYYVLEYYKGKVINVSRVTELNTKENSKVISLSKKCEEVNIVIGQVNDKIVNFDVIKPTSVLNITLYSLLNFITLFSCLFALNYGLLEIFSMENLRSNLNSPLNYIVIGAILVLSILYSLFRYLGLRIKNKKAYDGGALEYEFI